MALRNRKARVCFAVTLLALLVWRPALPVWVGLALIAIAAFTAGLGLSQPSPAVRRAFFSRLVLLFAAGGALVLAGASVHDAPWRASVSTPAEARAAMLTLLLYVLSLTAAPALVWAHLACLPRPRRARPRRRIASPRPGRCRAAA